MFTLGKRVKLQSMFCIFFCCVLSCLVSRFSCIWNHSFSAPFRPLCHIGLCTGTFICFQFFVLNIQFELQSSLLLFFSGRAKNSCVVIFPLIRQHVQSFCGHELHSEHIMMLYGDRNHNIDVICSFLRLFGFTC